MYSYEDRIRAVELYIKLGKRVRATIRQLGYPTKNALKGWYREYERPFDLPRGYARSKPKYSQKQKEVAVRHFFDHGRCIAFTIKALGYGSYLGEISPAPDNLLNRDFRAGAPNEKWLTDITEFQIPAGKVYLSPMIDCFDGMVVSWSLGTRPDAELVNTMLDAAIETVVDTEDRPVVHADRGAHHRWPGWLSRIADAKLIRSMSRKGYSPDNAACEGFFGRLKTELFYPRNWQSTTIEQFIQAVDSYIRWYNEQRIKISLGSLSPIEYRESLGLTA
ncbi:transposase InsO family protein [Variovorax boronicumulans]|uniref:IS3 family transposase n=1 Tax=Variovorax boronicumulans TaxID=436515 RepID=UPI002787F21A|nr:IS3 family transposase [Variovorax boronicumulans]MDP9917505.1 transposase InsO family protein [Variovorax boronicumulans]